MNRFNHVKTAVVFTYESMPDRTAGFTTRQCRQAGTAGAEIGGGGFDRFKRSYRSVRKQMGILSAIILALSLVATAHGEQDAVTAVHATIQKVDSGAKTIVVKTDDGAVHTVHFLDSTAVHGGDAADVTAKDSWHGLKEGGEVVVHYTKSGTDDTAVEIDRIGADGLKATEGTVKEIDRGGKNLVVVSGDGTEQTFRLTGEAAKETGAGVGKGSKVTVVYIGKAGKKIAHFLGTTSSGPY
jgi:hypothetical protein